MEKIKDFEDLQGVLPWGHSDLQHAKFVLLHLTKDSDATAFLRTVLEDITHAGMRPKVEATNLAFTHSGLSQCGLPAETLNGFSREFKEGMNLEYRRFLLGDYGANDEQNWKWGSSTQTEVHLVLMLYAKDADHLEALYSKHKQRIAAAKLEEVISPLDSVNLPDNKEHFGFRDGIAQPYVTGLGSKKTPPPDPIATGEFLLGYKDEYDQFPRNPVIESELGDKSLLPDDLGGSGKKSFGQNGSYLVFRQLEQNVSSFWKFLDQEASNTKHSEGNNMVKLAAKMVGRWPSGVPLVKETEQDTKDPKLVKDDDFLYHATDEHGYKCPMGSHIRRSNPRDALDPDPKSSLEISRKHRILRRGRIYGPPLAPSMKPEDMLAAKDDGQERGLLFLAFSGDINRQFEFSQRSWINSPKFDNLYNDSDPVIGNHYSKGQEITNSFSVQACPVRHRVTNIPQFVTTRGGAYFFLPSMRALKYLGSL